MFEHLNSYLVAGILFFSSLIAGRVSEKTKIPALILFLAIAMLAGSDGPGGLVFNDAGMANAIGSVALAFILFSGGFDTHWPEIQPVALKGMILSTAGVFLTAIGMAYLLWAFMGFSFADGMLMGSIISSTDAAAVFTILRSQKCGLKKGLKPLLEFESGSNDPMAVFLTVATLQWIIQPGESFSTLFASFVFQMVLGGLAGFSLGHGICYLVQRMRMENEALYPVLGISIVLFTFGFSEAIKGNGYLAVYICGMVMANGDYLYKRTLAKFHEGFAWLMQISMFLVLGLLVNPRELLSWSILGPGLVISFCLMFIVRPLAVVLTMFKSGLSLREQLFIGWTGLRGAVPIILATYPLLANYSHAARIFDLIFFVVITSVLLQGKTLTTVAKWLGVHAPFRAVPRYPLEFTRTPNSGVDETREVDLLPDSRAVGRRVHELDIPEGVTILLIHRGDGFLIPKGRTGLEAGDTLLIFGDKNRLQDVCLSLAGRVDPGESEKTDGKEKPLKLDSNEPRYE
ncbi:MAG: potassium/proton antiporter [Synergistaceae bacterium]|jgi:cell volume regulation protein A|nr:potassium/proton antiporter [Synergistaceae bacterium]